MPVSAYKNASLQEVPTTRTEVYVCPLETEALIVSIICANKNGVSDVLANIEMYDDSTSQYTYVGYLLPVPAGGTLTVAEAKLFLEENDKIYLTSSANNSLSSIVSILQITPDV